MQDAEGEKRADCDKVRSVGTLILTHREGSRARWRREAVGVVLHHGIHSSSISAHPAEHSLRQGLQNEEPDPGGGCRSSPPRAARRAPVAGHYHPMIRTNVASSRRGRAAGSAARWMPPPRLRARLPAPRISPDSRE